MEWTASVVSPSGSCEHDNENTGLIKAAGLLTTYVTITGNTMHQGVTLLIAAVIKTTVKRVILGVGREIWWCPLSLSNSLIAVSFCSLSSLRFDGETSRRHGNEHEDRHLGCCAVQSGRNWPRHEATTKRRSVSTRPYAAISHNTSIFNICPCSQNRHLWQGWNA
jgi:hypothetical protein